MDFGSSHVYSGDPYYSPVPVEKTAPPPVSDTIYEAVEQTSVQNDDEGNTYDPVAPDINIERREYDLVPYEPNLDETNNVETNSKPVEPKKSTSSSMFHKAFKAAKIKNRKKKLSKSTGSVSELDLSVPPPLPPPRPVLSKPLPPIPGQSDSASGPPLPPKPRSLHAQYSCPETPNEYNMVPEMSGVSISGSKHKKKSILELAGFDKPLYPALPNVYSDSSFGEQSHLTPTAPQPTNEMVINPDDGSFELIDFDTDAVPSTVSSACSKSSEKTGESGCDDSSSVMTPPVPSAPPLSASLVRAKSVVSEKPKNIYGSADTNVVSVKMSILEKMENSMIWAMPPQKCSHCEAVLFHRAFQDDDEEKTCRFCNAVVDVQQETLPLVGNESDVTYILNQPTGAPNDDPIIVFCIDTSGSMCVTSEIQAENTHFMSRLQAVKDGIQSQLQQLHFSYPKCRVAIVAFSDTVVSLGDGSPAQRLYLNDAQLYDTDYILKAASDSPIPGYLGHTHAQLLQNLHLLKEHGGTALGPALFLSVAIASKRPGSRVILCTDGRANVGIGSLESESDYKMCHNFYKETGDLGIKHGTMVSIVSIEGTDCRLVELGKVADLTAGQVRIGSVGTIGDEFRDILTNSLMATQTEVKISTQNQLYFNDGASDCPSLVSKFVGNITRESEVAFKYGVKEEHQNSPPESALFQLQMKFRVRNGCTCLRVITQERPVTENRVLAEQGLNPAVVGTYASQLASKLVLDGDLRDAKLITDAHKNLINRAMSIRSTMTDRSAEGDDEKIYGSVCANMDEINQEIKKVVQSIDTDVTYSRDPNSPPPLPPRPCDTPSTMSRSSSMSSIAFPDVPNNPLATKEKLVDAVEHCPDEVATKLFKHRNACQGMFAG